MLRVQSSNSTGTGSNNCLAVGRVNHVTGSENSGNGSLRGTTLNRDGVVLGNLQLVTYQFHARIGANSDKQALNSQLALRTVLGVG